MDTKVYRMNKNSSVLLYKDKLYIVDNKLITDEIENNHQINLGQIISPLAVLITTGFYVEMGSSITYIRRLLKETRLPIVIKEVMHTNNNSCYQIIRMSTGKVDDKILANIVCTDGNIKTVSFNRKLLKDSNYRRYNNISKFALVTVSRDLVNTPFRRRGEQLQYIISNLIFGDSTESVKVVLVKESFKAIDCSVIIRDTKLIFKFLYDKSLDKFIISSIEI